MCIPEDPSLGLVLFVGQQLEFDVRVAAGLTTLSLGQISTLDDRHNQGSVVALVPCRGGK